MDKKRKIIPFLVIGFFAGVLVNRGVYNYQHSPDSEKLMSAIDLQELITKKPLFFSFDQLPFLTFLFIFALSIILYFMRDTRIYDAGREHGTDRWGTKSERHSFKNKDFSQNLILGEDTFKSISDLKNSKNNRNNNVIVIGGSGAWKTTSYLMTNLAQMNSSFIVTDPKGQTIHRVGKLLKDNHYNVLEVDFDTLKPTARFNCFAYIHNEIDLKKVIATLIDATNAEHAKKGDPFWDKAEQLLITALCSFLYYKSKGDGNLKGSGVLPNLSEISELVRCLRREEKDTESPLELMFEQFKSDCGRENYAYLQWKNYLNNFKDRTADSVLAVTITRFSLFDLEQVKDFIKEDNLHIENWCTEKTAIFLKIADLDDTFSFLPLLVFLLAFRTLESRIDNEFNGKSPIPVQFLLDEFVNLGRVPDVDKALRVFRSRGMSVTLIIQDIFGLKKNYEKDWKSFFGNCDSWVYLSGSSEDETAKWFSEYAGTRTIYKKSRQMGRIVSEPLSQKLMSEGQFANLPRTQALVKIASVPMFKVNKYNYMKHPQAKHFGNKPTDENWYEVEPKRNAVQQYLFGQAQKNLPLKIEEIEWEI